MIERPTPPRREAPRYLPTPLVVGVVVVAVAAVTAMVGAVTNAPAWMIPPVVVANAVGIALMLVGLTRVYR